MFEFVLHLVVTRIDSFMKRLMLWALLVETWQLLYQTPANTLFLYWQDEEQVSQLDRVLDLQTTKKEV